MKVNEIKGYEEVKANYTVEEGKLYYNGKEISNNIVKTKDGLAIEIEPSELTDLLSFGKIEVHRDGRLFYTLDYDTDKIATYLRLPRAKFKDLIDKDMIQSKPALLGRGLSYKGFIFKLVEGGE